MPYLSISINLSNLQDIQISSNITGFHTTCRWPSFLPRGGTCHRSWNCWLAWPTELLRRTLPSFCRWTREAPNLPKLNGWGMWRVLYSCRVIGFHVVFMWFWFPRGQVWFIWFLRNLRVVQSNYWRFACGRLKATLKAVPLNSQKCMSPAWLFWLDLFFFLIPGIKACFWSCSA